MVPFDIILFDLLVKHNCVIIPDFGGFVSKRVSSKIDFDQGIIIPPAKHLLFNKHLVANDGLFLTAYADRNGLRYIEAEEKLKEIVLNLKKDLSSGKALMFSRIGVMKRSTDGFYTFSQDKEFNLLSDAYGLKKLEFDSVMNKEETSVHNVAKEDNEQPKAHPTVKSLKKKRFLRYAAAACILPLMMYTFWIPFKSDFFNSGLLSIHDFDPFYIKEVGRYQPNVSDLGQQAVFEGHSEQIRNLGNTSWVEDINLLKSQIIVSIEANEPEVPEYELSTSENEEVPYSKQYIVGCFSVKENAINFRNKISADGFVPLILDGGKLYRVSMGLTYSKEEYNSLKHRALSMGYNGWNLKQ